MRNLKVNNVVVENVKVNGAQVQIVNCNGVKVWENKVSVTNYNLMYSATSPQPFPISAEGIYFKQPWQLFTNNVANAGTWNAWPVIVQDLLKVIEINEITYWYEYAGGGAGAGAVGQYHIDTSLNGSTWTTRFTGTYKSKTQNLQVKHSNLSFEARYLRLRITNPTSQSFTLAPIITKAKV